jgi:outer membrane cobalamin receptor
MATITRLLLFTLLGPALLAAGSDDNPEIGLFNLSLEELGALQVNTASGPLALSMADAPGIVTVITREELLNTGAKDLVQALNMMPGISFAAGPYGFNGGPAIRGNMGQDGKILMLLDGMELTERAYGTSYMGHRIPLQLIDRIEIMRGPGSALYGGFAELAVINIISRPASDLNGTEIAIEGGVTDGGDASLGQISAGYGSDTDNGSLTAFFSLTRSIPGEGRYTDAQGGSYYREEYDELTSLSGYTRFQRGKFRWSFYADNLNWDERIGYGLTLNRPYDIHFQTLGTQMEHEWTLSEKLKFHPTLSAKRQWAWSGQRDNKLKVTGPPIADDSPHFPFILEVYNVNADLQLIYNDGPINFVMGWKPELDRGEISEDDSWTRGDSTFDDAMVFDDGSKHKTTCLAD